MNIHEHQAKQILKQFGAVVPEGVYGFTVEELLEKCKSEKPEIIESISSSGKLDEDIEKNLASLINDLKEKFKNA